jgi:hypothetical protein
LNIRKSFSHYLKGIVMLRKIIFSAILIMSSPIFSATWYRGIYGHYSFGTPAGLERSFSETEIRSYINALRGKASLASDKITCFPTSHESLRYWYGGGYQFSPHYAVEIDVFYASSFAQAKYYKNWRVWKDFEKDAFIDKKERLLSARGELLTGKLYSRAFKLFQLMPRSNRLVAIPNTVKDEKALERYLHQAFTRRKGLLHEFNFYLQGGIGRCKGQHAIVWDSGKDYPEKDIESNIQSETSPWTFTLGGGIGAQYHLTRYLRIEGAWFYICPIGSEHSAMHPFHILKLGVHIGL